MSEHHPFLVFCKIVFVFWSSIFLGMFLFLHIKFSKDTVQKMKSAAIQFIIFNLFLCFCTGFAVCVQEFFDAFKIKSQIEAKDE